MMMETHRVLEAQPYIRNSRERSSKLNATLPEPRLNRSLDVFNNPNSICARAHQTYRDIHATLKGFIKFCGSSQAIAALKESPASPSI
jgi:hypothetical protein